MREYFKNMNSRLVMLNSLIAIAIITLAGMMIYQNCIGFNSRGIVMMLVVVGYLIMVGAIANLYPDKYMICVCCILIPLNVGVLPYMYLFTDGGGLSSGMPIWIAFGILLVCILTEGVYFKIVLPITLIAACGSFIYGYICRDSLTYSPGTEFYYYQDNMAAVLGVSCSLGLVLKYQKYMWDKQNKELEKAMQTAEDEKLNAQKANEAKTQFLSSMSHDIRTPMNAIVGMVDIARYDIDDKETVKDCLDKISSSSTQLLNLLNNVLDMSEIERNELKLKNVQFNMEEVLENIQVVLTQSARSRKVNLNFFVDIHHTNLIGDSVRFRQMLMNIITNGIKYTENFGKVDVNIEEVRSDDEEQAKFVIDVIDTGVGMTADFIDNHMFKPFERSNEKVGQRIEGSGIGMSTTKGIVEAMGAELSVESEVGEGSQFTLTLSFKIDNDIKKNFVQEKDGLNILDATGKNLLVVEDNEINMEIVKAILERTHAHVSCVWNAEEAIDLFGASNTGHFDLIFMDIQLPGMDGYAATRTIRNMDRPDATSVPIIAMTANAFAQDVEKALNSGMNAHIAKPIDIDELFQKMYHFLYTVE